MSATFRRAWLAVLMGGTACTAFAEFDASATFAPIDACIDAGILALKDGALTFRHDLARRAIEDEIPPIRQRELDRIFRMDRR